MDASMESLLETYLFETNSLLDGLDELLINAEKIGDFSEDDVNEIFRSMHTIKGSSAMMEFNNIMTVAHRIEDMFFIIREQTMSVVQEEDRPALFDVVFQSIDFFRGEVEKVESGEPLDSDIDSFMTNINTLIAKIKGEAPPEPASAAPAAQSAPAPAPQAAAPAGADGFPFALRVNFEEGSGMEGLRAFMYSLELGMAVHLARIFKPELVRRYQHTKKKRTRKKYEKRILAWFGEVWGKCSD